MVYSVLTGAFFFVTWAALGATGSRIAAINVLFAVAVVLGWTWITILLASLQRTAKE